MDRLNLSDNIIRLRRERRITQEELADFLGVSKAAVSKWENAQSTPDLMLLLELSAYFGTTIDELIGYKAKLSKEQIRYFYAELVKDFARLPFHEAIEKTRTLAHRYYSCHAFLLQLTVLYRIITCWQSQKRNKNSFWRRRLHGATIFWKAAAM